MVSHLIEHLLKIIQSIQILNLDVEEFFDRIQQVVIGFVADQSESDAICAKSACSSNSVKVVCVVWLLEATVSDVWHIVIEDQVHLRDVDTTSQDICANETVGVLEAEAIDDPISLLLLDATNKLLCSNAHLVSKAFLKSDGINLPVDKDHVLRELESEIDLTDEILSRFFINLEPEHFDATELECLLLDPVRLHAAKILIDWFHDALIKSS